MTVEFDLTDNESVVKVKYTGILPDLFREGEGIVANGRLDDNGFFIAREVLAEHDENYMPPEVSHTHRLEQRLEARRKTLENAATGRKLELME